MLDSMGQNLSKLFPPLEPQAMASFFSGLSLETEESNLRTALRKGPW